MTMQPTLRAFANSCPEVRITWQDTPGIYYHIKRNPSFTEVILPLLPEHDTAMRGLSDMAACTLRYHLPDLNPMPTNALQRAMFTQAEEARIMVCGMLEYPGMKTNIAISWLRKWAIVPITTLDLEVRLPTMLATMIIETAVGPIKGLQEALFIAEEYSHWHNLCAALWKQLPYFDQAKFSKTIETIIIIWLENLPKHQIARASATPASSPSAAEGAIHASSQEDAPSQAILPHPEQHGSEVTLPHHISDSFSQPNPLHAVINTSISTEEEIAFATPTSLPYHAFTTRFDTVVRAHKLTNATERVQLRKRLDAAMKDIFLPPRRLMKQLAAKLRSYDVPTIQRHQESGFLDPRNLTQFVANPSFLAGYMQPFYEPKPSAAVTILIDNSGSMRGTPILLAAMMAELLTKMLDGSSANLEILGFTTQAWRGGECLKEWKKAGSPAMPGRLNGLCHIIYKHASDSYKQSKSALSVMLKEGILKENIDGEALEWAYQRLLARPESKRILIVISDGIPMDETTVLHNGAEYLQQHLKSVIQTIESRKDPIKLVGIGIGHNLSDIYQHSILLKSPSQLTEALLEELIKLL